MAGRLGARRGAGRAAGGPASWSSRLARLHDDLATTSGVAHDRALAAYGEAQSRFEALGGYAVEADAHRVLAGLGFAPGDAGAAAHRHVRAAGGCGPPSAACSWPSPTC